MSYSIFICGVGGQGLVLLTSVIGRACARSNKRAITGEMYGLSQRSGTVSVHLRIGDDAHSPLIPYGSADALVALEATEALRYIEYLRKGGLALVNGRIMHPPIETSRLLADKSASYFSLEEILKRLRSWTDKVVVVDALKIARESGNPNVENTVFLGCLSALRDLPVDEKSLRESLAETVPKGTVEQNLKAFDAGKKTAIEALCSFGVCRA
ncbi:MAG: indolepyruvate oxidoreductase subunit beta [Candidatus Methanomethylicia archaeon]|nr:indolepyruvate oxidoreductase subunit beta [Candidatus Methanomethylicia archaeon]